MSNLQDTANYLPNFNSTSVLPQVVGTTVQDNTLWVIWYCGLYVWLHVISISSTELFCSNFFVFIWYLPGQKKEYSFPRKCGRQEKSSHGRPQIYFFKSIFLRYFLFFFNLFYFFCILAFFGLFVCFLKLNLYILIQIRLYGRVSDKNFFTQPISGNKTTFFGSTLLPLSLLSPLKLPLQGAFALFSINRSISLSFSNGMFLILIVVRMYYFTWWLCDM